MTDSNPYQTPESTHQPPESAGTEGPRREPSGLGGWLILVAIGLVFSPFRLGAVVLQIYMPLFQDGTWATLTTPGSEQYHVLWAPLLILEIVANLGFIVAYSVLAFLFFRKSRFFPKTYIAIAIINLCFIVLDAWFASFVLPDEPMLDPDTTKEMARSLVSAAIWVPYMIVSKRVRNTFVD